MQTLHLALAHAAVHAAAQQIAVPCGGPGAWPAAPPVGGEDLLRLRERLLGDRHGCLCQAVRAAAIVASRAASVGVAVSPKVFSKADESMTNGRSNW